MHPGFCDAAREDFDFPFDLQGGSISNPDGDFVGFDTGAPALSISPATLSGSEWTDVMTYCKKRWLSAYTYTKILAALRAEYDETQPHGMNLLVNNSTRRTFSSASDAGRGGRAPVLSFTGFPVESTPGPGQKRAGEERADYIVAIATVTLKREGTDEANEAQIKSVRHVSLGFTPTPVSGSRAVIQLKNQRGEVIARSFAPLGMSTDQTESGNQRGIVNAFIPFMPGTGQLELLLDGEVVALRKVSPNPPKFRDLQILEQVVERKAAAVVPPGTSEAPPPTKSLSIIFHWRAEDADADELTYTVEMSTDGGETWKTVAADITETSLSLDPKLAGIETLMIRVTASDGFNSSSVIKRFTRGK
jgi:hypothetical protein